MSLKEPPGDDIIESRESNLREDIADRSPESDEAREIRIEIIRQEGKRVRALRLKVSLLYCGLRLRLLSYCSSIGNGFNSLFANAAV